MHGFVSAATIRAEDAAASRSLSGKLTENLRITRKPARGRALETTTAMEAGAVVLAESPICWWVDPACQDFVCAHCLETFDAAAPGIPAREEDADATSLVHFVAHAVRLQRTSPAEFDQLWSIMLGTHVTLSEADETVCRRVAAVLQGTSRHDDPYLHLSLIRELCKKDKTANFAVMLPPKKDSSAAELEGLLERRARGYATYPYMSLVNHSCLPTVARFDHFDRYNAVAYLLELGSGL
ncbi:hypothetical protein AB1Y20_000586 [Prymnesium parvum]|uniref:SET domain-containing protein n=1 Tax=Prymnesium parvum TaxID=97485 RepID=A0AB34KAI2_PRYPA